jgi:hypothetical protein
LRSVAPYSTGSVQDVSLVRVVEGDVSQAAERITGWSTRSRTERNAIFPTSLADLAKARAWPQGPIGRVTRIT